MTPQPLTGPHDNNTTEILPASIGHYIDGNVVECRQANAIAVINPATEEQIGWVARGTHETVDAAAFAARDALTNWSATPVAVRTSLLRSLADALVNRRAAIAAAITAELGAPVKSCAAVQVDLPVAILRDIADHAERFEFVRRIGHSTIFMQPVGVVGAITPWNFPLYQIIAKIAPALAMGCTVVLKPSELTPLAIPMLVNAAIDARLPAGVLNIVNGEGSVVGAAIVAHPAIDKISFTGSTFIGKQVAARAASSVKRLSLELGGKSAALLLADAPLEKALNATLASCMFNSGQTCTANTRLLIPASMRAEAAEILAGAADRLIVGDPTSEHTDLGPLVSDRQRQNVRDFIVQGEREGARLIAGGAERPDHLPRGYFVKPTIFAGVRPDAAIAQHEIFGPVLSIIEYSDEEEAVRISNSSEYGLAGAVWSSDTEHATRVARRMRTGRIDINDAPFNISAPTGGFKHSGYGRELGPFSLDYFVEAQSVQRPL